jgi:pimeloyl-ACP methyl ester carboxylesterase
VIGLLLLMVGCLSWQVHPPERAGANSLAMVDGTVRAVDQGAGDAIVLLHGFGGSLEVWEGVRQSLARGHHVLALDARGFGRSDRSPGDYSTKGMVRDVVAAMDARGLSRATIVAHSWGSGAALALALAHPERVERLVLVDSLAYPAQVPWFLDAARTPVLGEVLMGAFYTAQVDARLERAFYDPSLLEWTHVEAVRTSLSLPGSRSAALAVARGLDLEAQSQRYSELTLPVLVVWGAQDQITPPAWGERLVRDLPHGRLERIDRCGHFPMLEAPERFTALVADFLP